MIRTLDVSLCIFAGARDRMIKTIGILLCCCLTGCALRHTEEIGRLQAYGREGDAQQRYVKDVNAKFDALLAAVRSGGMSAYQTQKDFQDAFGDPIFTKSLDGQGAAQLWLYRYCEKLKGSEKVYLYFDASGTLLKWEHVAAAVK